jgi:hypothetical protein
MLQAKIVGSGKMRLEFRYLACDVSITLSIVVAQNEDPSNSVLTCIRSLVFCNWLCSGRGKRDI